MCRPEYASSAFFADFDQMLKYLWMVRFLHVAREARGAGVSAEWAAVCSLDELQIELS